MLEAHLHSPVTRRRLREGRADHIDAFANLLNLSGYRPLSVEGLLRSLAGWTGWMLVNGFSARDFLRSLEACKLAVHKARRVRYHRGPNRHSITAAALFIRFLQYQGELPLPPALQCAGELWPLLGEFRLWMHPHRGVTKPTLDNYVGACMISDDRPYRDLSERSGLIGGSQSSGLRVSNGLLLPNPVREE